MEYPGRQEEDQSHFLFLYPQTPAGTRKGIEESLRAATAPACEAQEGSIQVLELIASPPLLSLESKWNNRFLFLPFLLGHNLGVFAQVYSDTTARLYKRYFYLIFLPIYKINQVVRFYCNLWIHFRPFALESKDIVVIQCYKNTISFFLSFAVHSRVT